MDYTWVNDKIMGFITSLRRFDVHLVIVAHEKLNDGKKGDGKLYPRIGGATLISKAMAEMDVVAHIERTRPDDGVPVWFAQVQPTDYLVGKDGTNALGERRVADLSRWVELMREYTRQPQAASESDLPWTADLSGDESPVGLSPSTPAMPVGESTEEPSSDAEAQAALARATAAEPEPLDADDWALLDLLLAGNNAEQCASRRQENPAEVREHVTEIKRKMRVRTIVALLELARKTPREVVVP